MQRTFLTSLCVLAVCTACGGDTEDTAGSCRERSACGGDIVGSWAVQNICVAENTFAQAFTSGLPSQCDDATEQAALSPMDLVVEYTAGGTTSSTGALRIDLQARLSQACLNALAG